jgi:hypothetical protein
MAIVACWPCCVQVSVSTVQDQDTAVANVEFSLLGAAVHEASGWNVRTSALTCLVASPDHLAELGQRESVQLVTVAVGTCPAGAVTLTALLDLQPDSHVWTWAAASVGPRGS